MNKAPGNGRFLFASDFLPHAAFRSKLPPIRSDNLTREDNMDDCIKTCPHCGAAFSVNDLVYSEEIQIGRAHV